MDSNTAVVTGLSNREFLERYAQAGRVGLCGGATRVDIAIRRAQRHLDGDGRWSDWSHVFLFQGTRADGRHWVVESDIQIHRKHIQLGAQENRILLREALELVAGHERYSLRELLGTLLALRKPELRAKENLLARERCAYCSAFVQRLFLQIGMDLVPGVTGKHTTPEDFFRTPVPHVKYALLREMPGAKIAVLGEKIRNRIRARRQSRR